MATSTVPAVKAALVGLLQGRPGLAGVQVEYARPSFDVLAKEALWFEGARLQQRAEALGNTRRDETYTLDLVISVAWDGDDAQACEERMWELVAEVENTLRENPKPIPAPLFDVQFAGAEHRPTQAEGQRVSEAVLAIAARSRI